MKSAPSTRVVAPRALAAAGASVNASGVPEPALVWSGSVTNTAGLLQITRDFCDQTIAICELCRFPELIAGWSGGAYSFGTAIGDGRLRGPPSDWSSL